MAAELIGIADVGAGDVFGVYGGMRLPVTFIGVGLAGAETIVIQISHDGGGTFQDVYYDGSRLELTATNNVITVYGPGIYRGNKSGGTGRMFVSYDGSP